MQGVLHLSGSQLVLVVVLSFVWAALGYMLSEHDRKTLGRTPWGLPSALWALFWFLSLLLGLVLYLIAHSTGVRRAHQSPPASGPYPFAGPMGRGAQSVAEQFPAYPRPANSPVPPTAAGPIQAEGPTPRSELHPAPGQSAPIADATTVPDVPRFPQGAQGVPSGRYLSPPAWHPDPSGRFHYRWWDGSQWTSHVSLDGHVLIDTNPDQRIGPY